MMDAFLHACGVHPALELEVEASGQARSTRYCLRQPFAIVGRHPASDVYLDVDGIRPRHVYFQAIEGRMACINVSQTGTIKTSEKEVDDFCWLKPNEAVEFGNRSIKLVQEETDLVQRQDIIDPMAAGSAWEIFGPRITLEITNDEADGVKKTWLVDRLLTLVGRTPRCAIQLNDEFVSNVHCSLVLTSTGLWVVDLLGRGGVIINEQPVRVGQLGLEDELRLGPFRIRLQEMPVAINIPMEEKAFRPLTPAGEFLVPAMGETGSHHQIRMYHTPWPDDLQNADVLEELMEKLQDMQGPMFLQYQHVITRMIETFDQLNPKQQEAVKSELDRLRQLSEEVESMENPRDPVDTPGNIVLPEPSSMDVDNMSSDDDDGAVHPDALSMKSTGEVSSGRSANSLLLGSATSVFRIPTKSGDLFENVDIQETRTSNSDSLHTWNDDTELLSTEGTNEATGTGIPPDNDIAYGYDPDQHDQNHSTAEQYHPFQPRTTDHAEGTHPSDREKAAHLWLHDRIDVLQEEQSSIWQKLSQFFFGRSSW